MWRVLKVRPGRSGRAGVRGAARRARPRLVWLEDRAVPAVFEVSSLLDSGAGSLRQAILDANAAPGADVVLFAEGFRGTITLTSGELPVAGDLTIEGPGASVLAVSGNGVSRVFRVDGPFVVTIEDLTLTQGQADAGGAVYNAGGTLTLARSTLSGNQAASGGGVYLASGSADIQGSELSGNRAIMGGALYAASGSTTVGGSTLSGNQATTGGAVQVAAGSLEIDDSRLTDNQVAGSSASAVSGGALYLGPGTALDVRRSEFSRNRAVGSAGFDGGPGHDGGWGGWASGGAVFAFSATVQIADSLFARNEAAGGNGGNGGTAPPESLGGFGGRGGSAGGGAVDLEGTSASVDIVNVTFDGNRATGGNGGNGGSAFLGQGGHGGFGGPGGDAAGGGLSVGGGQAIVHLIGCRFSNQALAGNGGDGGTPRGAKSGPGLPTWAGTEAAAGGRPGAA
jgi:hypothetical protein